MKDYLVEIKIKNNYLFSKMRENNITSINQLSVLSKTQPQQGGQIANLKVVPFNRYGKIKEWIVRIADVLNCEPLDLFPHQHIDKYLDTNKASLNMNLTEMKSLTMLENELSETSLLEDFSNKELKEKISEILTSLKPREAYIIEMRYGLNDRDECSLSECSEAVNVSRERIRQIEAKALRKLRHPSRSNIIKDYC
jgi:RNA polymerase sigma factor (sigma-70 family)